MSKFKICCEFYGALSFVMRALLSGAAVLAVSFFLVLAYQLLFGGIVGILCAIVVAAFDFWLFKKLFGMIFYTEKMGG